MVLTPQMGHTRYILMAFSLATVLRTPALASYETRLRFLKRIEGEAISNPLQSLFGLSESQIHDELNASNHEIRATLPQPFHDILDIPPEERHLPDGMTIYDILEMPAMSEANLRRIAFSRVMPTHIPNISEENIIEVTEEERFLKVIKRQESDYVRACAASSGWVQVNDGITVENEFVEVSRGQFFFQTTCLHNGGACYGYPTPSTATADRLSKCTTLKSWVIAWAKVRGDTEFGWRHIALATCCACAVKGKPGDGMTEEASDGA
ncbi:uncharacterized protein LOC105437127 [Strongylocentrotus purpuratus]|uniref:Uncharacterized protein n=1 Tax=Strongylocentrotus purpuratus TaxID=7668 RepID=A0A7M7HC10_STRPU|nr:uncharacterized protein LOC105437127 [Strongylocentrotus purpuratus]|eukprot:XP_011661697.1 PREDICTED: uncharacterized protein LOC105437127 [Strongylocentrotus purpuratus]